MEPQTKCLLSGSSYSGGEGRKHAKRMCALLGGISPEKGPCWKPCWGGQQLQDEQTAKRALRRGGEGRGALWAGWVGKERPATPARPPPADPSARAGAPRAPSSWTRPGAGTVFPRPEAAISREEVLADIYRREAGVSLPTRERLIAVHYGDDYFPIRTGRLGEGRACVSLTSGGRARTGLSCSGPTPTPAHTPGSPRVTQNTQWPSHRWT